MLKTLILWPIFRMWPLDVIIYLPQERCPPCWPVSRSPNQHFLFSQLNQINIFCAIFFSSNRWFDADSKYRIYFSKHTIWRVLHKSALFSTLSAQRPNIKVGIVHLLWTAMVLAALWICRNPNLAFVQRSHSWIPMKWERLYTLLASRTLYYIPYPKIRI